jgi:uncharacterized damage-inducible protein DinB
MDLKQFITQSLTENTDYVMRAVKDLTPAELAYRPKPHSNSIAFLCWHLARVEDLWISRLRGTQHLYETAGWYKKFGTPAGDFGFGYGVAELDAYKPAPADVMTGYAQAVRKQTLAYLDKLDFSTLDTVKDFGHRQASIGWALTHLVDEVGEHSGQIGYLRGIQKGIEPMPAPQRR